MLNVTSDGCRLEQGAGPSVVFLHGLAGSAGDWEPTLEVVSDGARDRARPADVAARTRLFPAYADRVGVWGEDDDVTPMAVATRLHQRIRHSTMFVLRGCGHAPMIEHPYVFGRVVRAWLEGTTCAEPAVRAGS